MQQSDSAALSSRTSPSALDWKEIARLFLVSRTIDAIEEKELLPAKKVLYQFSARGHDLSQIILGQLLNHSHDGVGAYYRSRPLLLALGLSIEDAFAGPLGRSGGYSDGRDIGVVCNLPPERSATVLPMAGDVGSQFSPVAGWSQSVRYFYQNLGEDSYKNAIGVVHSGEAAVATSGFWSSLTMATTLKLPMLFFIEDNGYGISVPSQFQTPGANIARNLSSFTGLKVLDGDGTQPEEAAELITTAVEYVRTWKGPCLLRLTVPRLSGHSGQDTQAYKSEELKANELKRDPLISLKKYMSANHSFDWSALEKSVETECRRALEAALDRPEPDRTNIYRFVFEERDEYNRPVTSLVGGDPAGTVELPREDPEPEPSDPTRINMLTAIRRTMDHELRINQRLLLFGEDVGAKGGVHAATLGLQESHGEGRVFDTSLSEEGIIGRAVGMAICGLKPVAEIQFRKYADPATEQINNCGTIRWRTNNRFSAPVVIRMPGGYARCGDPWHSKSDEVAWIHQVGLQVAYPSNAQDACGLLRAAMRSNNPTIFFEHRHMLDAPWARRPYPGDDFILPFGMAKRVKEGDSITVVSWGGMVERCELALEQSGVSGDLLDLRTLMPWDKDAILESVAKTKRCILVHEDTLTAGFGAEIAATLAKEAFFNLDAPVERLCIQDIPVPYNVGLLDEVLPSVEEITKTILDTVAF